MIYGDDNIHDAMEKVAGIKRVLLKTKKKAAPIKEQLSHSFRKGALKRRYRNQGKSDLEIDMGATLGEGSIKDILSRIVMK